MVKPEELRFNCTRCGNCCTDNDTLVSITYLDILRLKTGLKLDPKEILDVIGFYVFDQKLTEETLEKMVISPIETERGLAFTGLLKNNLGDCYFYDITKAKCLKRASMPPQPSNSVTFSSSPLILPLCSIISSTTGEIFSKSTD